MKSKAPLALIELSIMLLVLALASALCLRIFVWADTRSRENSVRDTALVQMQSAAETLKEAGDCEEAAKRFGGTWDGITWQIPCEIYTIRVIPEATGQVHLCGATVEAVYRKQVIVSFSVYWQEVA